MRIRLIAPGLIILAFLGACGESVAPVTIEATIPPLVTTTASVVTLDTTAPGVSVVTPEPTAPRATLSSGAPEKVEPLEDEEPLERWEFTSIGYDSHQPSGHGLDGKWGSTYHNGVPILVVEDGRIVAGIQPGIYCKLEMPGRRLSPARASVMAHAIHKEFRPHLSSGQTLSWSYTYYDVQVGMFTCNLM